MSNIKDFDSLFTIIGEFGPYQKKVYLALCMIPLISCFHMLLSVFILAAPEHRCALPGWSNDTFEIQNEAHRQMINLMIPDSTDETLKYSQCKLIKNNISVACNQWVYDKSIFKSTFTSEQNLVCTDELRTSHASMIFFGGVLAGAFGLGTLSDMIGRKKTLYLSSWLLLISTMAVAWAPSFWVFCVLRFIVGFSCAGLFMTAFVLGMEIVGPSKRVWAGVVIEYFFAIGLVVLAGIAYAIREWKYIEIAVSVPSVFFLLYWWLVPESPRWLLSQGRHEEAEKIIRQIAKGNNVTLPEKALVNLEADKSTTGRVWHLFTDRVLLIRTLIIFFNWLVVSMGYYGLSLNTGNLSGDFYLNFFLSGLVEFPAYTLCLVFLDRVGRKKLHVSCFVGGGLACICTIFTMLYADESLQPITVTLAMIGKIGIAAAFAVIYVWSAEIYPTVVRNAGMGASSACARIGGMVSPYIADVSKVVDGHLGRALPLVIFGGFSVLAGLLSLLLPETLNHKLPETIQDGKEFGKKENKYFPSKSYSNQAFATDDNISTTKTESSRL
ncbi:organic cation transporter protein-like isoform X2 [Mytilus galloprovincialis]|uniref:organic cation transporter protein-like isoform X2 n=1 Tax=Mytilus galloprovincialis TaxID=29158 RepID=UPI003F7CB9A7